MNKHMRKFNRIEVKTTNKLFPHRAIDEVGLAACKWVKKEMLFVIRTFQV